MNLEKMAIGGGTYIWKNELNALPQILALFITISIRASSEQEMGV
jgi:hypothetical protein